jgi:hypothetical protein
MPGERGVPLCVLPCYKRRERKTEKERRDREKFRERVIKDTEGMRIREKEK